MVPGPWARGYGTPHNYHQRYPEYQQKNNYNVQQYGRNNYQNPQYSSYGSQYNQQRVRFWYVKLIVIPENDGIIN